MLSYLEPIFVIKLNLLHRETSFSYSIVNVIINAFDISVSTFDFKICLLNVNFDKIIFFY